VLVPESWQGFAHDVIKLRQSTVKCNVSGTERPRIVLHDRGGEKARCPGGRRHSRTYFVIVFPCERFCCDFQEPNLAFCPNPLWGSRPISREKEDQ